MFMHVCPTQPCPLCSYPPLIMPSQDSANVGWKCPGCGKCYSPATPKCFTCKNNVVTS
jgi:hypothetical protein